MDEFRSVPRRWSASCKDGGVREYEIHPEDFGLKMISNRGLKSDALESKTMLLEALDNIRARREIVVLNAGVALYAANAAATIPGIERARAAIVSVPPGEARSVRRRNPARRGAK
jgi:anthranilate phosphoribosyltransferase